MTLGGALGASLTASCISVRIWQGRGGLSAPYRSPPGREESPQTAGGYVHEDPPLGGLLASLKVHSALSHSSVVRMRVVALFKQKETLTWEPPPFPPVEE